MLKGQKFLLIWNINEQRLIRLNAGVMLYFGFRRSSGVCAKLMLQQAEIPSA